MKEVNLRFKGIASLYGYDSYLKIKNSKILIIGLGGVGTWTCEALVRSGVENITLVDLDDICVSNTNRQIHAHIGNYGKFKIDALEERMLSINPDIKVKKHYSFFNEKNVEAIFSENFEIVIDAMDSVKDKCFLFDYCFKKLIPVVSAGGVGGKKDPSQIEVCELEKTKNDMLFKGVRKKLRQEYRYPIGRGKAKVTCVYSKELGQAFEICELPNETAQSLDCEGALGSVVHMTGIFGFLLANSAIEKILK